MKQSELLKSISKLSDSQRERIIREIKDYLMINEQLADTRPDVCPCCGKHTRLIKKGKQSGKQRYQCKTCGSKFVYDSHHITSCMKITHDEFIEICLDTITLVPIKETAARLNRSIYCVFNNRHKFLALLEKIVDEETDLVSGTIEFDEKYILESNKGSSPENRKSRKRGGKSNYRGISHEQVCIVTTTDRTGHEIFKAVGYAKPTSDIIADTFSKRIEEKSVIFTDGLTSYDKLAAERQCQIKHLIGYESYNKVEHLNTVNSIHSMIEKIIEFYKGIATKYINRYTALFVFMRRMLDTDRNEKADLLVQIIKNTNFTLRRKDIRTYNLFSSYSDF